METVIDWSKAPEGTEAVHPGSTHILQAWFKRDANGLVHQICPGAGVNSWSWMGGRRDFPYGYVLRPSTDKQTWDGGSLPPVGTVCEWAGCTFAPEDPKEPDLHIGDWVTIIAHFKDGEFDLAAFTFNPQIHNPDRGTAWVSQGSHGCFRTIRTPEQIAADDRQKGIEELGNFLAATSTTPAPYLLEAAQKIYDAGYRKQVQS